MKAYFFKHKQTKKRYKVLAFSERGGKRFVKLKGKTYDWEEEYNKDTFIKRGYALVQEEDDEAQAA